MESSSVSRRRFVAGLSALALAAGLSSFGPAAPARAADKLPVVASFSILGDLVRQVGGDRVDVKVLVGPGGDAHVYAPTPSDVRAVAGAKLVVVNGLGFEGWLDRLVKASRTAAPVVVAAAKVTPREMADEDGAPAAGHDHAHLVTDPHAWQAVPNVKLYVEAIRDGLVGADPDGRAVYEANATAYAEKIAALDAAVRDAIAKVPPDARKVVTSHDAFGYFAAAYGIEFLAPQGISTEAEATAKGVAKLIRQIRAEKVTAVFVETVTDKRLIDRIAKETGVRMGGELYSDALSVPNGPASTYIDMVRHNVKLLTAAMAGS